MKILKTLGALLIVVAAICGVVSIFTHANNGTLTSFLINENNLIHSIEKYEGASGPLTNGLTLEVNKNGAITIDGKYDETKLEEYVFVLGTVKVDEEDFYSLSGVPNADLDTVYLTATYEDLEGNKRILYSDFADTMTTETKLPVGTEVVINLVVKPGASFKNVTIKPTFVSGTEAGKF